MEQKKATENLSQWFKLAEQTPWETGVYKVPGRYGSKATYFSYWCGIGFHGGWNTVERAIQNKNNSIEPAYKKWRGLASDPSAKPKPKARGNRRVTRYVVMLDKNPIAVFDTRKECLDYVKRGNIWWSSIEKIRFRTPEAD